MTCANYGGSCTDPRLDNLKPPLGGERYVQSTSEYAAERASAEAANLDTFAVKGTLLEDALGPRYLDDVFGKSRVGSLSTTR